MLEHLNPNHILISKKKYILTSIIMSRPTLWSTGDIDEDLTDAVDVELSMYAQQGHQPAVYDHLGAQIDQLEPMLQQHMALAAVPDVVKSVGGLDDLNKSH